MTPFFLAFGAICILPALAGPLIVGLGLVKQPPRLRLLAGWLTLKPLAATPLFLILLMLVPLLPASGFTVYFSLLPGLLLTAWIAWSFRDQLHGPGSRYAAGLFVLDLLRWGSTLATLAYLDQQAAAEGGVLALMAAALAFPTLYALAARRVARLA